MGVEIIIDPPYVHYDMPKSLGQIHSVEYRFPISGPGNKLNCDLPGELTQTLSTLVRAGQYFKTVGVDMAITATNVAGGGATVTGKILYYVPTHGRCQAFRGAFKAMKEVMKNQGINMHDNRLYDFRAPINDDGTGAFFPNQATLDGVNGLCLNNVAAPGASIFAVHNESVQPQYTGTASDAFGAGFDTVESTAYTAATGLAKTDFVLNDAVLYSGNRNNASVDYEEIPFTLSYTPGSTDLTLNMEWRPDPALYVAVLCGQLQFVVDEVDFDGGATTCEIDISVMVSGWKSIMGDPSKRKSRSKSKTSSGRMSKTTTTVVKK